MRRKGEWREAREDGGRESQVPDFLSVGSSGPPSSDSPNQYY